MYLYVRKFLCNKHVDTRSEFFQIFLRKLKEFENNLSTKN